MARLDQVLAEMVTLEVPLSIDTTKAAVAARALSFGAVVVNDVWGLQKDPRMADAVAEAEAAVVIMHNRAEKDESLDIIADIRRFFERSLAIAAHAGIPKHRTILDVGIGFAKSEPPKSRGYSQTWRAQGLRIADYGRGVSQKISWLAYRRRNRGNVGRLTCGESSGDRRWRRDRARARRRRACGRTESLSDDPRH